MTFEIWHVHDRIVHALNVLAADRQGPEPTDFNLVPPGAAPRMWMSAMMM